MSEMRRACVKTPERKSAVEIYSALSLREPRTFQNIPDEVLRKRSGRLQTHIRYWRWKIILLASSLNAFSHKLRRNSPAPRSIGDDRSCSEFGRCYLSFATGRMRCKRKSRGCPASTTGRPPLCNLIHRSSHIGQRRLHCGLAITTNAPQDWLKLWEAVMARSRDTLEF